MEHPTVSTILEMSGTGDPSLPTSPQSPTSPISPIAPQSPVSIQSDGIPMEQPAKLRGRKRLYQSLQRMSSSPSLARLGRAPSAGYRAGGRGTVSCVSLSSTGSTHDHPYGSSYSSELSAGFSTAPTSAVSTPPPETLVCDQNARIRFVSPDVRTSIPLPADVRPGSRLGPTSELAEVQQGYFSRPAQAKHKKRLDFNFWRDLPTELRLAVLEYLDPLEVVRCSAVSKSWHRMCFDGQLWGNLDTSKYYRKISAEALVNIIKTAGPFVRDLNLRGCVQLREQWANDGISEACKNLEYLSLEGCRIDRTTIHCFLLQNTRLVHINLSGLPSATNSAMKIISQHCPNLEYLNISWCNNIDTRGVRKIVEGCPRLRDLRAGEIRGWNNIELMNEMFKRNTLERLVLMHCDSLTDEAMTALIHGVDSEIDYLTGQPMVPPRRLKHLDLTRCQGLSDRGVKTLAHNAPFLEGLQLSKCVALTDACLVEILPTLPMLTHLDLEEVGELTNASLQALAGSPSVKNLKHLSISYCENLGDAGMLPVLKHGTELQNLDMDNTRISDLTLAEAAHALRERSSRALVRAMTEPAPPAEAKQPNVPRPSVGLRLAVYDCQNVTWTGVREVLSRNAEIRRPYLISNLTNPAKPPKQPSPTHPTQIIHLKCFYGWQPTVEEHMKRVLRGDFAAASRLERKWADFMQANEEAGAGGSGGRRRRRRAREAQMMHADEEEGGGTGAGVGGLGVGRRRRARSGGCVVM
jgi:F-box and leucine-rich repeat protein 2/20